MVCSHSPHSDFSGIRKRLFPGSDILQQSCCRDFRRGLCRFGVCGPASCGRITRWVTPGEMLDGLGLAETTPGPLILVLPFVGFLAAFRNPGDLHPMMAGTLGAMLTTWATFVPCYLWVLVGGPYVEALRGNKSLHTAMSSITAAIVGVVLNLAVWFALHTVFGSVRDVQCIWGTFTDSSLE